jgi:outer membrane receptor protein involved in Fe transport
MRCVLLISLFFASTAAAHDDGVSATEPEEPASANTPGTTVTGRRPAKATSQKTVEKGDFELNPRRSAANLLEVAPGLVTVQAAGGGKANQYFLRGFDVDHGTDLALSVDSVPVNLPTHAHGQGYSDLNFVIPELIERIDVSKGPYAARDGDFATAGAVNLITADHLHQNRVTFTAGNFGLLRGLLLAAPEPRPNADGYLGAEVLTQNGPFENPEHLKRYAVNSRVAVRPAPSVEVSLQLQSMMSDWSASGALPLRLIESGEISRFGSLSPTDGGNTFRHAAVLGLRANDVGGGRLEATLFGFRSGLDLYSDFTFYAVDPVNGDQLRQTDLRTVTGASAQYRRALTLGPVRLQALAGVQARSDVIDVALGHTAGRVLLETRTLDHVSQQSFGAYAELDASLLRWLRAVAGLRADGFHYQVKGTSAGSLVAGLLSPKGSLILTPHPTFSVTANAGRGFHSNDARALQAPTAATSYEVGGRYQHPSGVVDVGLVAWALDLDSELVWNADEGHTESAGPSRRRGLELDVRARPVSWLSADVSGTLTEARFVNGDFVPLAPIWTVSAGLVAHHPKGLFGAVRWTQVGARPANEDATIQTRPIALLDASLGCTVGRFTVALEALNLLNSAWYEGQFVARSRGPLEAEPSEGLHVTAGRPLQVRTSLTVTLD